MISRRSVQLLCAATNKRFLNCSSRTWIGFPQVKGQHPAPIVRFLTTPVENQESVKKRVAVVLIGCGGLDASEPIEAISLSVSLAQHNMISSYFSPNDEITNSYNHQTRELDASEERYMRREAARLSRGSVDEIGKLHPADFDAVILVGGSGWARNVTNIEFEKSVEDFEIMPSIEKVIRDFHHAQKYIGTTSYAGCAVALALGKKKQGPGVLVTIGKEPTLAEKIEQLGSKHEESAVAGVVIDQKNKIISVGTFGAHQTAQAFAVFEGVSKLVETLTDVWKE